MHHHHKDENISTILMKHKKPYRCDSFNYFILHKIILYFQLKHFHFLYEQKGKISMNKLMFKPIFYRGTSKFHNKNIYKKLFW